MSKKIIISSLSILIGFLIISCSDISSNTTTENKDKTNQQENSTTKPEQNDETNNGQINGQTNDQNDLNSLEEPKTPEVDPNIDTEDRKYNLTYRSNIKSSISTPLVKDNKKILYTAVYLSSKNISIEPVIEPATIRIYEEKTGKKLEYSFKNLIDYSNSKDLLDSNSALQNSLYSLKSLRENFHENIKHYPIISGSRNNNSVNQLKKAAITPITTYEIGHKKDNIYLYKRGVQNKVNTTLRYISKSAYFFIENGIIPSISENILKDIATSFEKDKAVINKIYANNADIDNNGKIIFVIAPFNVDGLKGFFTGNDKLNEPYSNKGDYIYINSKYLENEEIYNKNKIHVKSTLIHEYQHMTLFDYRHIEKQFNVQLSKMDSWIDEGLSMLAEYHAGYGVNHREYVKELFRHSNEISLLNFEDKIENYGFSLLFFRYMQTRFKDEFIKRLYDSEDIGIKAIYNSARPNARLKFDPIFQEFIISLLLSGRGITENPRYDVVQFNHSSKATSSDELYWYKKNGFNLAEVIDEVYDEDSKNSLSTGNLINNKDKELTLTLKNYSFQLTRWHKTPENLIMNYEDNPNNDPFWAYFAQY